MHFRTPMARDVKLAPWYLAALTPFVAMGAGAAMLGHVLVVALAVGLFRGTMALGSDQ